MLILKLLRKVYSGVGTVINSIYHWLKGDLVPSLETENNSDDDANAVIVLQPHGPPVPPPLLGLQLFAAMQFPFLQNNRPSLRDLLLPLAEALSEHQNMPQSQLRLGKRWRRETQAENVQAIEKALQQFELEDTVTKEDSQDSLLKPKSKESDTGISPQMDNNCSQIPG
ncbi:uncharacterized protein LOC124154559 [Ischnura elegans]|uniref:uncharacterized protein LOC124154559 n=1 Tax=Ischnura elegans TaxID=197161 RepID=UPI001ED86FA3|nr:uncharacterized protein LOC124154559 [Ischnura elegans]